jgi:hypothetical protein
MKKTVVSSLSVSGFLFSGLFLLNYPATAQENSAIVSALPDEVNKIVIVSCMPCHTSTGGLLSRGKLNFTEWTKYSPEKQKEKAEKIYSEIKKGAMPPKSARETRPEIIPTKEQMAIVKKWAESFPADIQ